MIAGILGLAAAATIDPAALRPAGRVDARYQSYNVEMVEVTGGRFWKPYRLGPPKDAGYALSGVYDDRGVTLNGEVLKLEPNDIVPRLDGAHVTGTTEVAAGGVTLVALDHAGAPACR